jgi:predicted nuclease of restriction endonuclease-like (RecB) superfamily
MPESRVVLPEGYQVLLEELKERIRSAQVRAALVINRELVMLYWRIGRSIRAQQDEHGWGTRVIRRLSADLREAFPDMKGFSPRNLQYMRTFVSAYPEEHIAQQVAAQLPWGHLMRLLDTVPEPQARAWYAQQATDQGWSRAILAHQVAENLYDRQGRAQTNFPRTLPVPQSELAQQILKDPYIFDFLSLGAEAHERDLERALLAHIQEFLIELGVGFAFVGSQYHLEVGNQDFFVDLLFYHLKLRAFVVIELKLVAFQPEDAGKMNFYLSAVDDLLRHPDDQPSIGLILCREQNKVVAEYALRDMSKPIGVSAYELTAALPEQLQGSLPTIEELEAGLSEAAGD